MTIHKPDYYDKFICIADKCMFTCCKDWKIGVDQYTKQKWGRMRIPDETVKRNNLAVETYLDDLVGNGGDSIKLCKNGRCPFLNERDLCDIVLEYGEENISLTCHTYPRENHIYRNCNEMTLAMGCPAALDLLLESREFRYINQEDDKKEVEYLDDIDSKLVLLRDRLMAEFNNNRDIEISE